MIRTFDKVMRLQVWLSLFSVVFAFGEELPRGFVSLFNGKDLTGWRGNPAHWKVEDGCIVGTTDGSLERNRFLIWDGGSLENFELRVQVRVSKGGNSGVQYRSRERPELGKWVLSGYQSDVLPAQRGLNGMFYEEQGRRIMGRTGEKVVVDRFGIPWVVGQMEGKDFPAEEWRDYRILVRGNHHQHWIDGHLTADAIDDDIAGRALKGLLGVQVHVGPAMKVEYRNFWLKELPSKLPANSQEIATTAHLVRPQQPLPRDWVAPIRGEFLGALEEEFVEWDELKRKGFVGSKTYQVNPDLGATHFRVWIGGSSQETFVVRVDDEIVFSGKRVNPTWQLLNLPLKEGRKISLEGAKDCFWAEPSLWKVKGEGQ